MSTSETGEMGQIRDKKLFKSPPKLRKQVGKPLPFEGYVGHRLN
jgi:hypothetical protein